MLWYRKRACTFWSKELQGCYLVYFCHHCKALCTSLRFPSTGHIWGHLGFENVALSEGPVFICKFALLLITQDCSKLARILSWEFWLLACPLTRLFCCTYLLSDIVVAVACCGLLWDLGSVYGYQKLWRIWGNHFVTQWQTFLGLTLTDSDFSALCWLLNMLGQ